MCRAIDEGGRRCPNPGRGAPRTHATPTAGGADVADSLTRIYADLAEFDGAWISLTEVRRRLPHIPRHELDAELLRLLDREDINIAPEANQQTLTPADRDAAIHIGGKDKHLVLVNEPIGAHQ